MDGLQHIQESFGPYLPIILLLILWEAVWKLIALWKAARHNQLAWFICLAIINSIGILSIIYILMHRKKAESLQKGTLSQQTDNAF